jgi:hypothetical protein
VANTAIQAWVRFYNSERPHQALNYRSPAQHRAAQQLRNYPAIAEWGINGTLARIVSSNDSTKECGDAPVADLLGWIHGLPPGPNGGSGQSGQFLGCELISSHTGWPTRLEASTL